MKEEKDGESVSQKIDNDTDNEEDESLNKEEEESLNEQEENGEEENNNGGDGEDLLGRNLVAKEMMSFHPSMEDLVELISESGVMLKIKILLI